MRPHILHDWPRRTSEAARIQREILKPLHELYGLTPDCGLVLGIEVAFNENLRKVYCASVLMRYPGFSELERGFAEADTPFPPNSDLHSFREGGVICKSLENIKATPDFLMIQGEGVNAISEIGIATHMGMIFDIPSIGCARRMLSAARPKVGKFKGATAKILRDGQEVAIAARTKRKVKPIYISPGYKMGLADSERLVMGMLRGFRTPEPIRVPHLLVMRLKNESARLAEVERP